MHRGACRYPAELTDEYLLYLRKLFGKLDNDNSGYVTHEELTALVIESERARFALLGHNLLSGRKQWVTLST